MKYLRLLTYVVLFAAVWQSREVRHFVEVSLSPGLAGEADEEAHAVNRSVAKDGKLLTCARSGREILEIARVKIADYGVIAQRIPVVTLVSRDDRLYWHLVFTDRQAAPGAVYRTTVWVDDLTGEANTGRSPEPNQPPQRNAGSHPSSDDSPVPETPSSLGPRG